MEKIVTRRKQKLQRVFEDYKLHRVAMKAALGIQMIDHPEDKQLAATAGNKADFGARDGVESIGPILYSGRSCSCLLLLLLVSRSVAKCISVIRWSSSIANCARGHSILIIRHIVVYNCYLCNMVIGQLISCLIAVCFKVYLHSESL